MSPFRVMAVGSVLVTLGMVPWLGCANTVHLTPPVQLLHLQIEADENARLDVVCEEGRAYSVDLKAGTPLELGGPEILCKIYSEPQVELSVEAIWDE